MMGIRGWLYKTARVMGDMNALKKKKVARRIARRAAGKATGKLFRKLFG